MSVAVSQWRDIGDRYWIYHGKDGKPVCAIRFETQEINDGRYDHDKTNYEVGFWNSWVKVDGGNALITWPEETPIEEMQSMVEEMDVRI